MPRPDQAYRELAADAEQDGLNAVYRNWPEWRLQWPPAEQEFQAESVEVAVAWTCADREHASAWQYGAWALMAAVQYEEARQAGERAQRLRADWPQLEDEFLIRQAEMKLEKPGCAERWQFVRGQLELEIYRTPLRRWLLQQSVDELRNPENYNPPHLILAVYNNASTNASMSAKSSRPSRFISRVKSGSIPG